MSIVRLFDYDISPILAMLPALDDAWGEETWRQAMPFTPHRDSQTIFLRRQPGSRPRDVLHQLASVATRHHAGALAVAIEDIYTRLEGRPARAMLVRLAPGGVIAPHTDSGIYAEATVRFHLPLVTNPGAWLEVDGEKYHLPVGALYAFDKHVPHRGGNDGDTARVHMILDLHPESPDVLAG